MTCKIIFQSVAVWDPPLGLKQINIKGTLQTKIYKKRGLENLNLGDSWEDFTCSAETKKIQLLRYYYNT